HERSNQLFTTKDSPMLKLLAIVFDVAVCFLGASAKAEGLSDQEKKQIQQALKYAEPISKGEIDSSIDRLVKQGVISAEDAVQAKENLQGLSPPDVKKIQDHASPLFN